MRDELKPCPFCGGSAGVREAFSAVPGKKIARYVSCNECGAIGEMFYMHMGSSPCTAIEKAVKAWNRRMKEEQCE